MAQKKALEKAAARRPSGANEGISTSQKMGVNPPDADHKQELNDVDREIIGALTGFRDTLRARTLLVSKYTVRQVVGVLPPPEFGPDDVRRTREEFGVSQPVFADFLGTSTSTIRAWEQGQKSPSPMARRLLGLIAADPIYWKGRFSEMTEVRAGGDEASCVVGGRANTSDERANTVIPRRRRPKL
jgi:putative transcriptional regulator